jgi:hypothetical protein
MLCRETELQEVWLLYVGGATRSRLSRQSDTVPVHMATRFDHRRFTSSTTAGQLRLFY